VFAAPVALLVLSTTVQAQVYESVGVRAQGMGGAFVAVADDATASWWNPAGLARGAYFSSVLEFGELRQPDTDRDASGLPRAAWLNSVRAIAVGYPALAISYYRLRISEIEPTPSTAPVAADRQDQGAGDVRLRSLSLNQFGATFGQSVGDHLVLASTLKLLRSSLGLAAATGADATLSRAKSLEGSGETHFGLDAGTMVTFPHMQLGLAVKNLTRPTFGRGDHRIELQRQARGGVSFRTDRGTGKAGVRVALDADLTRTATAVGEQRHVAAGIEVWTPGHGFAFRAGGTANTIGEARPSPSAGVSLRLRSTTFVDAGKTFGSDRAVQGWGVALRAAF
jgi:hypothetical protein